MHLSEDSLTMAFLEIAQLDNLSNHEPFHRSTRAHIIGGGGKATSA